MTLLTFLEKYQTFSLHADAQTADDALKISVKLLENTGCVTEIYLDKIRENWQKNGPYFVLVPGFAMPHAEPGEGVSQTGFSLVTLRTPVSFGHEDNDPVDVLLCVAAENRDAMNQDALIQVMNLLDSETALDALRNAENWEDVRNILEKCNENA